MKKLRLTVLNSPYHSRWHPVGTPWLLSLCVCVCLSVYLYDCTRDLSLWCADSLVVASGLSSYSRWSCIVRGILVPSTGIELCIPCISRWIPFFFLSPKWFYFGHWQHAQQCNCILFGFLKYYLSMHWKYMFTFKKCNTVNSSVNRTPSQYIFLLCFIHK